MKSAATDQSIGWLALKANKFDSLLCLDDNCSLDILELLGENDLFAVSQTNRRLHHLANEKLEFYRDMLEEGESFNRQYMRYEAKQKLKNMGISI